MVIIISNVYQKLLNTKKILSVPTQRNESVSSSIVIYFDLDILQIIIVSKQQVDNKYRYMAFST